MKIKADTGEIWQFMLFLHHLKTDVSKSVEEDRERLTTASKKLRDIIGEEVNAVVLEDIAQTDKSLGQKQTEFQESMGSVIKWLKKFVTYLEEISFDDDYAKYKASYSGAGDSGAGSSSSNYGKMQFRGISFYVKDDNFDFDAKDAKGRSNLERMTKGKTPIGKDGLYINLHHMCQTEQAGIAEVLGSMHTSNHRILHINPSSIPSGIDRKAFSALRADYWKRRAALETRRRSEL